MRDVWTPELKEKLRQLEESGDAEAARNLRFGRNLYFLRRLAHLSQDEAATLAGVSRITWVRIENGLQQPRPSSIAGLAKALKVDAGLLFQRAGYPIPQEYSNYTLPQAHVEFETALMHARLSGEFFYLMSIIWQKHRQQGGKSDSFIDLPYAQVLSLVLEKLSADQRLRLARDILEGAPREDAGPHLPGVKEMLGFIDEKQGQTLPGAKRNEGREQTD